MGWKSRKKRSPKKGEPEGKGTGRSLGSEKRIQDLDERRKKRRAK
jgi:hypothetical protein